MSNLGRMIKGQRVDFAAGKPKAIDKKASGQAASGPVAKEPKTRMTGGAVSGSRNTRKY